MITSLEPFFVDDFVLVFFDFLEPLPLADPDTGAAVGEVDGSSLFLLFGVFPAMTTTPSTEESAMMRRVTRIRNKFFMLSVLLRINCENNGFQESDPRLVGKFVDLRSCLAVEVRVHAFCVLKTTLKCLRPPILL